MNNNERKIKILRKALLAAQSHLDFCGYGDEYERECADASGLEKMIDEALMVSNDKG